MTGINPFAPAGDPTHPSNWRPTVLYPNLEPPETDYVVSRWIRLDDDPATTDRVNAALIGADRWPEYGDLLGTFGTTPENLYWNLHSFSEWPDDAPMPTLTELRARQAGASKANADAIELGDADLAAKLKAMEDAGL